MSNIHDKHYKPSTLEEKCNECNTYHFGMNADFMSGALHEDVYTSKESYN